MKAISLWEPWASLIRTGAKTYETRHWPTKHRGPLLICAAKGGLANGELMNLLNDPVFKKGLSPLLPGRDLTTDNLYHGEAVAIINLVDCIPTETMTAEQIGTDAPFGNFSPGRFAWKLENTRAIDPFPVKGRQGLFNVHTGCDNCGLFHSSCFGHPDNTENCNEWKPIIICQKQSRRNKNC